MSYIELTEYGVDFPILLNVKAVACIRSEDNTTSHIYLHSHFQHIAHRKDGNGVYFLNVKDTPDEILLKLNQAGA